jgi:predicted ATPase/two-component sensor histidine kinase
MNIASGPVELLTEHDGRGLYRPNSDAGFGQFDLGRLDTPDTFYIPDKLYGRRSTVGHLVSAYEEVADRGGTELVLVSGPSGVGKSAVVGELLRQLVISGSVFAVGKCDQPSSDIPYATLAAALGRFLSGIINQGEEALARWRPQLLDAVGPNGQLLAALIPALGLIIGAQTPATPLPALEARNQFYRVFKRFLRVLAELSHPFVLFIDDMQWIDIATVDLLSSVLADAETRHLFLLGSYRANEVNDSHPLTGMIQKTMAAGTRVREISLAPLRIDDVEAFVVDCLRAQRSEIRDLAVLIHELSAGNPFFSKQLMAAFAESGLLAFDRDTASWTWNTKTIRSGQPAGEMSGLMTNRLVRLPAGSRKLLQTLACLGNRSDAATLAMLHAMPEGDVHLALSDVVRRGLLQRSDDQYAFSHDKIQEAAYGLVPENARAAAHLQIGMAFVESLDDARLAEKIFEVVNQLNRGIAVVVAPDERMVVARLNLAAAKAARASTAHAAFRSYIGHGSALLPPDGWRIEPDLMFEFAFNFCESEFLLGNLREAEQRLATLSTRDITLAERSVVTWLQITLFTAAGKLDRAVSECLSFLETVGVNWVPHPDQAAILEEYAPIRDEIDSGSIDARLTLPVIADPIQRIILDVLTALLPPAFFTDNNLVCLVLCRMATISKIYGNSHASSLGYAYLGMVLGPRFGAWAAGYNFGHLGFRLSNEQGLDLLKPRVQMTFSYHVMPYTMPIAQGDALLREAFDSANDRGDLTYAGFSSCTMISSLLFRGAPLQDTQDVAEAKLRFITATKFGLIVEIIATQLRLIRSLRGLANQFPTFNDEDFDEANYELHLDENPELSIAACWYWIRKLQLRVIGSDFSEAVAAASRAAPLIWTSGGHLELVEYHFYAGLAKAALCSGPEAAAKHMADIIAHGDELATLAAQCPENFAHHSALLKAELARIDGRSFDALRLYQAAIDLSRQHSFMQIEALAHETAARFCIANGLTSAGCGHVGHARDLYLKQGAIAKVRQLQTTYADIRPAFYSAAPLQGSAQDDAGFDATALLKIAVASSADLGSDALIETLMTIVLQTSNATRCLLILPYGDQLRLEAESTATNETIEVSIHRLALGDHHAPSSVIRHVSATRRMLLLDDAKVAGDYSVDSYILSNKTCSLLCLPLVKRTKLLGILYLENSLTSHTFTAARVSLLTLLTSQVAISLENASLEEKESLLKEVHHRVKNNLQLITSLLNLQAARAADPAVSELFEDSRNRVRSMALVHENLYRAGNLARISMALHVHSLCTQLFRSYAMHQQRITLSKHIDDIQLDLDRAISCGLLVNELVSNALKHAFPEDARGTIRVALIHANDRHLELSVEDDGIGLPAGGVSTHSLGLQLVDDLTHQLRGTLFISSVNGARFMIRFPLNDD